MFRKTLMVVAVVVVGCGGVEGGGSTGPGGSSLGKNYGHGCLSNADCSDVSGASCNGLSGSACTAACDATTKCPSGTTCIGNTSCAQNCTEDADCLNGGGCVFNEGFKTGICGYAPQKRVGEHCNHDYECSSYSCNITQGAAFGVCE